MMIGQCAICGRRQQLMAPIFFYCQRCNIARWQPNQEIPMFTGFANLGPWRMKGE